MILKRYVSKQFTSNTFVLKQAKSPRVWFFDVGASDSITYCIEKKTVYFRAFFTHAHYDHIFAINSLIRSFPDCMIFESEHTKLAVTDAKLNFSFYHISPITYSGSNFIVVKEKDKIVLYDKLSVLVLETPGYNLGSLSFIVGKYLITGDSFIPRHKVVTKLRGGSRELADKS